MSQIQTSSGVGLKGAARERSFTYVGTGAEGNSFAYASLSGKTLTKVSRQGRLLSITTGVAGSTEYIQYTSATTLFTLSALDVVGAGEVFIFYYY